MLCESSLKFPSSSETFVPSLSSSRSCALCSSAPRILWRGCPSCAHECRASSTPCSWGESGEVGADNATLRRRSEAERSVLVGHRGPADAAAAITAAATSVVVGGDGLLCIIRVCRLACACAPFRRAMCQCARVTISLRGKRSSSVSSKRRSPPSICPFLFSPVSSQGESSLCALRCSPHPSPVMA